MTALDRGIYAVRSWAIAEVGFDAVDARLERIEKLILADHKRRIERLEVEMRDLKDLLAVK